MRISVIIPVHNGELFVVEAIQSALDQTWKELEVIVVDDHSTDRSVEAAIRAGNDRLKIVQSVKRGAAAARNTGIRAATGDYIQFLDADDILAPEKLEYQMEILRDSPGGTIVSCPWGRFESNPAEASFLEEAVWADSDPVDWLVNSWSGGGMMQTACWLYPREIGEAAGEWDESLTLHDDGEFFCRVILASSRIRFCPGARVFYRTGNPGSLSNQRGRAAAESALRVCKSYSEHALAAEDTPRVRRAVATNFARFLYEFHPRFPDLLGCARNAVSDLGIRKIPSVGGQRFQVLARLLGFQSALTLRNLVQSPSTICSQARVGTRPRMEEEPQD